ncbi:taste receptor type 2 member 140-like [Pyxicephalus adspersus]|uniref:Taste receptor type 2 n=1 Tax=Pyxicephalus adspersus TaxID=30357 RepID=A0AAV3AJW7_PYXAD|nr:TPA: hypothetical protein GDO54_009883 [Pyxicephalus adspersus]
MTNSTAEDSYKAMVIQNVLLFACLGIILAGLGIQSFVVALNVIDWLKGRSITRADKIITSIGISRFFFHTACLLSLVSMFFVSNIPELIPILISFILQSSTISNIWLSTLLSIFFYFMVSTCSNNVFLRLKAIISRKVVCLIIASVLLSVGYSFFYFLVNDIIFFRNSTHHSISDSQQKQKILAYISFLWSTVPLFMFFMASILLIILLAYHISKMNNHGNSMSNTDTYHRTMKFTVFSFIVFALGIFIIFELQMGFLDILFVGIMVNIYTILQSALLIYVATKLRNQFFRIIRCGTDCLFNKKTSGPQSRERVEVTSAPL